MGWGYTAWQMGWRIEKLPNQRKDQKRTNQVWYKGGMTQSGEGLKTDQSGRVKKRK